MKTALSRVKMAGANLLVALLALLLVFGLAELTVRLIFRDGIVLFPRYHTDAKYGEYRLRRIRPNTVFWHRSVDGRWRFETNSQGFRNYTDFNYAKSADTVRVISLGDSHTQGYEVSQENTFSSVIERYLRGAGYKAEVLNAGVSGFSTAEELLFLENEGIKYQPDFVVLGFYANDFQDNVKTGLFGIDSMGNLSVKKKTHLPGVQIQNFIYSVPMVKWMSENSYFYSLLFNATWTYFKTRMTRRSTEAVFEYAVPTQGGNAAYEGALTEALIRRLYEFCRKNSIKLIILDVPFRTSEGDVASSLQRHAPSDIEAFSDGFVLSDELFGDYRGAVEIHRPHGHHHISEFAHGMLGVQAGRMMVGFLSGTTLPRRPDLKTQ